MARTRVAINGFGRIGRKLFRAITEQASEQIEIVAINDLGGLEMAAHLLKYDSTHGRFQGEIKTEGDKLVVNGQKITVLSDRDPKNLPWKSHEVEISMECTGAFKKKEQFALQIAAGAKKILVSAPAPEADLTVVYGVNHQTYDSSQHDVVSNASCTTNCLAPLAKVLHEKFGIVSGLMTTVHSYTLDQRILDAHHKDMRRARAAAVSMIPTTTGAAKAVGLVLPELAGKIDGFSVRVPTPNVSMVDLTFNSQKTVSIEEINKAVTSAAEGSLKGILAAETVPLVSCDFNGHRASSIVDLPSTMVAGSNLAKVISWYDNETGFSHRMVDMALHMANQ